MSHVPAVLLAAFMSAAAIAIPATARAQSVPQVDVYDYVVDGVYPVRTALGITTQVELDPAEEILDFSTGFSTGWDLSRRGNVFYLRPRGVDVDTNMLVRTQTHSYIFELKVVATDWTTLEQVRRAGVQYKVAFRYPADASFSAQVEEAADPGQSIGLQKGRHYNFDYDAASRRARDGEEFAVNTTVENGVLVVHGTYPFLVVRHGRNVVGLRRNVR